MSLIKRLRGNVRYALGLRSFLATTLGREQAETEIRALLATREQSFLSLLQRGIYGNPASPYRRLLQHFGFEFEDVAALVQRLGLEGALSQLYDAGVYVTQQEFKGFEPIVRGDLEIPVRPSAFDNPLLIGGFGGQTSGSRGAGTRVLIEFDRLYPEAAYTACLFAAETFANRPICFWKPAPPNSSGFSTVFRYMKIDRTPEKWFSQTEFTWSAEGIRAAAFLQYTLVASRLLRHPIPRPIYTPRDKVATIVHWLAEKKRMGTPALFDGSPSSATRVCIAAKELGLDISGTLFRIGGEPYTESKAQVLAEAGTSTTTHYSMTEIGNIGYGCEQAAAPDELHLFTDRLAVIQRDKAAGADASVPGLVYTTLHASTPQLMLNAESGDYGKLEQRECSCGLGRLGFTTVLSNVRSYDKLTSEGVTFMGSELYRLVEEVLPARFGGFPTDYQLVEEEADGLTRLSIVVSPGLGEIDETALVNLVLDSLRTYRRGGPIMAEQWRQGNTLRVVRREPYIVADRKILPLHVLKNV